jgi:hypothetical protein
MSTRRLSVQPVRALQVDAMGQCNTRPTNAIAVNPHTGQLRRGWTELNPQKTSEQAGDKEDDPTDLKETKI